MKRLILAAIVIAVATVAYVINKPTPPASVYWVGQNGHTYVKTAGTPTQDYGQLASGATIYSSTRISDPK